MEELLLSIDAGTQSLRALVFDREGRLLVKKKIEFEPYVPGTPGRAEQDPEVYWRALQAACRDLKARRPELMAAVAGVGITSQRATMVCLDEAGVPLRPAILWLDVRKARPPYHPGLGMRAALGLVGMNEAVMLTQEEGKCNWIMQNEPGTWEKTHKYVEVSGFLTHRLTGSFADSTASLIGHLPFDYKRQAWCKPGALNARLFPVPREKLPDPVAPGEVVARVTAAASAATGIPAGIPLVAAGSDKGCETIGMGVVDPTKASLSFGTTATIQTTSPRYFEPLRFMPAYPAPIPGRFNPEV
ncbi:MAG TPA: FGGY family carbohydrate kinase, partial [Spirochaetia bacterium]|nr:FGGY family carbohydrate kinase [Spirochaetia bacterium]